MLQHTPHEDQTPPISPPKPFAPLPQQTPRDETREIASALRSQRRNRRLQEVVQSVLDSQPLSEEAVDYLLHLLTLAASPRRRNEYRIAAWALARTSLSPAQREIAVQTLCGIVECSLPEIALRSQKVLRNNLVASAVLTFLPAAVFIFSFDQRYWLTLTIAELFWIVGGTLAWYALLFSLFQAFSALRGGSMLKEGVRIEAAIALQRMRAPESVGPLAKAVMDTNPNVYRAAAYALGETLPALTEEHYGQLGADAVPNMCRILGIKGLISDAAYEEPFYLALLDALEKVGDGRAVRYVERVRQNGWTAELRSAAERVLPTLLARREKEDDFGMLLRGSTLPLEPAESLLRPASAHAENAPEQLLRPVDGKEETKPE